MQRVPANVTCKPGTPDVSIMLIIEPLQSKAVREDNVIMWCPSFSPSLAAYFCGFWDVFRHMCQCSMLADVMVCCQRWPLMRRHS